MESGHAAFRTLSRRGALAGLGMFPALGTTPAWAGMAGTDGPIFYASGPNADRYGAAEGFPARWQIHDPDAPRYRVGNFSHFDEIMPTRRIVRANTPWNFERSPAEIIYRYKGARCSVTDYLARNPVTGLLIAKDDRIVCEYYQYGRTDRERLASQSMAKSIIGLLIGVAVAEGAVRSVDDTAATYVPEFEGTEYGKTPIRDLLHMSSGVEFGEEAEHSRDLNQLWLDLMGGYLNSYAGAARGTLGGIVRFNHRIAPPGTRFHYASIEADVLGVVLHRAVGRSASNYLQDKIWQPIGAEADASWLVDAQGSELAHGFFNAVLRDYARLGRLLAHDGAWNDKQVIPAQWMLDATTVRSSDSYLAPGKADPAFGYGYLLWLLPWAKRQFALFGSYGQRICVDPTSRLVLVQTAVDDGPELWSLWPAIVEQLGRA
ncbi:MAG: serine hydrolase [Acidisphaera sp.]|nr:serine hydrolase [Acidisphaera sp.]